MNKQLKFSLWLIVLLVLVSLSYYGVYRELNENLFGKMIGISCGYLFHSLIFGE